MRDVAAIRDRDYPIFATGASVSGYASERMLSSVGQDIVCGGIAVATDDFIVGDDDGVVCLPKARVQEILFEAEEIEHLDLMLEGDIEKGRPLAELHRHESVGPCDARQFSGGTLSFSCQAVARYTLEKRKPEPNAILTGRLRMSGAARRVVMLALTSARRDRRNRVNSQISVAQANRAEEGSWRTAEA